MSIFDANEKVDYVATQSLHYDRYSDCRYFLERVQVQGKYGLNCGEESDEYGTRSKVLLPPIYHEINVSEISSQKAIYHKYAVFANGTKLGEFTLVLNAWVPRRSQNS
jgi:hypothetical protein